jgi:hypothetical protein
MFPENRDIQWVGYFLGTEYTTEKRLDTVPSFLELNSGVARIYNNEW